MTRYEAKARYIERRNEENRLKADNQLTEEQIDALEWLCATRHDLHTNGAYVLTNSDICEHCEYVDYITGSLTEYMQENGFKDFPVIEVDDVEGYKSNAEWEWCEDDYEDYDEFLEECHIFNSDVIENINTTIEHWLKELDEKYGTDYCPIGATRIL